MSDYYIRRGKQIKGPFANAKIQMLFESSKLKANDEIAKSKDGRDHRPVP